MRLRQMVALLFAAVAFAGPPGFVELDIGGERNSSVPLVENSILLLPNFLSSAECDLLAGAAEGEIDDATSDDGRTSASLERVTVDDLDDASPVHGLSRDIFARVLGLMEQHLPESARALFGVTHPIGLAGMELSFSTDEPAINRYSKGGVDTNFNPHRDAFALTVNVLLSDPGAHFEGGGTRFWREQSGCGGAASAVAVGSGSGAADEPSCAGGDGSDSLGEPGARASSVLTIRPPRGTLVLFNGRVLHAGLPVTAGRRFLFVGSFDLEPRS
jgi:hypothetical protein